MVIRVRDVVDAADTQDQGAMVRAYILRLLKGNNNIVILSFDGVDTATSSFVNTCFVALLDHMSFGDIKRRIKVINSTRQINDMIKRRVTDEASVAA